ncbi:hypothetical protein KKC17_02225 [Patescibacteria group bacterium]|nr:hypothetical protein [Patescibacteria group bacterium]
MEKFRIGYLMNGGPKEIPININKNLLIITPEEKEISLKEFIEKQVKQKNKFIIDDIRILEKLAKDGILLEKCHIEKSIRRLALTKDLIAEGDVDSAIIHYQVALP